MDDAEKIPTDLCCNDVGLTSSMENFALRVDPALHASLQDSITEACHELVTDVKLPVQGQVRICSQAVRRLRLCSITPPRKFEIMLHD